MFNFLKKLKPKPIGKIPMAEQIWASAATMGEGQVLLYRSNSIYESLRLKDEVARIMREEIRFNFPYSIELWSGVKIIFSTYDEVLNVVPTVEFNE